MEAKSHDYFTSRSAGPRKPLASPPNLSQRIRRGEHHSRRRRGVHGAGTSPSSKATNEISASARRRDRRANGPRLPCFVDVDSGPPAAVTLLPIVYKRHGRIVHRLGFADFRARSQWPSECSGINAAVYPRRPRPPVSLPQTLRSSMKPGGRCRTAYGILQVVGYDDAGKRRVALFQCPQLPGSTSRRPAFTIQLQPGESGLARELWGSRSPPVSR